MKRGAPLKAKRDRPRRNEGRVQHGRVKERRVEPTAEQRRYWDWLRENVPLCECGCGRQAECIHHLLSAAPGKAGRRDHWYVVRLAHHCHNGARDSVHGLGSEMKFCIVAGADNMASIAGARLEQYRER